MRLIIEDRHLGRENYECEVYVDRKKAEGLVWDELSNRAELECPPNCHIQIQFINIIFTEKKNSLCTFMYWMLVLFNKQGEKHQFKIPSHALLTLESKEDGKLKVKTNPFWEKTAFTVKGKCRILKNRYYVPDSFYLFPIKDS